MKFTNIVLALATAFAGTTGLIACTESSDVGADMEAVTTLPDPGDQYPSFDQPDALGLLNLTATAQGCVPTGNNVCVGPIHWDSKGRGTCYACGETICTLTICDGMGRCSTVRQRGHTGMCGTATVQ